MATSTECDGHRLRRSSLLWLHRLNVMDIVSAGRTCRRPHKSRRCQNLGRTSCTEQQKHVHQPGNLSALCFTADLCLYQRSVAPTASSFVKCQRHNICRKQLLLSRCHGPRRCRCHPCDAALTAPSARYA